MLNQERYGRRGSLPAEVMRSGRIIPISPDDARQDVSLQHVEAMTDWRAMIPASVAQAVGPLPCAPAGPVTASVAQTTTALPPQPMPTAPATLPPNTASGQHLWHRQHRGGRHPMMQEIQRLHPKAMIHGAGDETTVQLGEWNGRPLAKFEIAANPPEGGAVQAASALHRAAKILRDTGLGHMPPELVAGPLAALLRGGAIELHFQNGAVVRTAL